MVNFYRIDDYILTKAVMVRFYFYKKCAIQIKCG